MKQKIVKALLILSIASVVMLSAGCGSKGDLYLPKESQASSN